MTAVSLFVSVPTSVLDVLHASLFASGSAELQAEVIASMASAIVDVVVVVPVGVAAEQPGSPPVCPRACLADLCRSMANSRTSSNVYRCMMANAILKAAHSSDRLVCGLVCLSVYLLCV